jgi:U3 small nucleolar RNA-associated protein 10
MLRAFEVSENPQTFNQALLLIGNMARFASESIIHTVMPIFTFIDQNVIHRDDEFSFKVVQQVRKFESLPIFCLLPWVQAITNIVPVMVSHFRRQQATGLDLYLGKVSYMSR